ncbi:isochorismatase family protein [Bosea sp. NPDC055332]
MTQQPALPWHGVIPPEEERRYGAAGFGQRGGCGRKPALLVIDVQYRTTGSTPAPYEQAVREYPTACGDAAWNAVGQIRPLLGAFRRLGLPVLYPYVAPKDARTDAGRLAAKVPAMFGVDARGYDFVAEVAPQAGDLLLPKKHPSAFFGTPLLSHLIDLGVDTLFVTGCSTSGCVRASVVDAFSYNFRVVVPQDCVFDRSPTSHAVNLFDMNAKYADVVPVAEALAMLAALPQGDAAAAGAAS